MIPFSGLSRFSGHFGGDGPSPLNRDTTVLTMLLAESGLGSKLSISKGQTSHTIYAHAAQICNILLL